MFHRTGVAVDTFLHTGEVMKEVDIPLQAVQPYQVGISDRQTTL